MDFLPFKTVYECTFGRDTDYVKLASQHRTLTLDREFTRGRFQQSNRTPFKEIKIVNLNDIVDQDYHDLLATRHTVYEGRASLLSRIRSTLKDTIMCHWEPGGYHIMFHSSGLDSRCISWLIRELYHEHGPDWLGTIVFACSNWEGASFKAIMRYQGWEPHQYLVAYEGQRDYYVSSLTDFSSAWEWSNGASPLAINLYWYPAIAAIEKGLIPDDAPVQAWTGRWGNTTLDYASTDAGAKNLDGIVRQFYKSTLCQRPVYGANAVCPYSAIALAKIVCESTIVLGKRLRSLFAEYLDPGLAEFLNMASDGDRHRKISDWIIAQMRHDYKCSWYGQHIHPEAKPAHKTTEFQAFWYHWTLASFCGELRARGIAIR